MTSYLRRLSKKHRSARGDEAGAATFHYAGFDIPVDLARLTGGGPETWDVIGPGHMRQYERYAPISADHTVFELGCGVGRDAIELTSLLKPPGRYVGLDIIRPSIEWARANIGARYPWFEFHHYDIYSEVHNNVGVHRALDFPLPVEDGSVDRVIAQSVFTHIFTADVAYYLREFQRILKPGGLAFATFFVIDDEARQLLAARSGPAEMFPDLTFRHRHEPGVWINDVRHPEGAVAYEYELVESLVSAAPLRMAALHRGYWPGRSGTTDGQDIAILRAD